MILDACCGGRMFWFDKNNPNVLFQDRRVVEPVMIGNDKNARVFECKPDVIADFRTMAYPDYSFKMVVFDPPHLTSVGKSSWLSQKYGSLDKNTWKEDLARGFSECFRVLKDEGILIFKWNEHDIKLKEVLNLSPYTPLFGHPSGKMMKTHWICFMKSSDYQKPSTIDQVPSTPNQVPSTTKQAQ